MKTSMTPMKQAMIMAFMMTPPELNAVMDKIDDLPTDLQALYTERNGKFELTGIKGIQTDANVARLEEAIRKERAATKAEKEKLAAFGDMTPEKLAAQRDRLEELEAIASGKVDDDKINELVEKRIKTRVGPLERENKALKEEKATLTAQLEEHVGKDKRRSIHDEVRSAALKAKVTDTALEDVLLHADRVFELTEDKKIITKDGVGVTPGLDPTTWIQEMLSKKPHWFPASEGGGATGGRGNQYANNPWSAEHWNMTEQGKIFRENKAKAEQMAKAAGTTIGGKRPAPKK